MSYANRKQMSSNRTASIIVVAILHVVLGYALVSGLAYNVIKKSAEDPKTFDVTEPPPPPEQKPPPPPKQEAPPPPVVAPPPMVRMQTVAPPIQTVPTPPPYIPPIVKVATPPPPPPPQRVEPARARGDLHSPFSPDDYPNSALQAQQQGTTAVSIQIGPDGRVTGCDVTSSSGSAALDSATCNIIRRRARYTPARDNTGQATSGTDSVRIRWVVPAD